MLYYDRIDISEGFDHTKSNRRQEWIIYHVWFFNHGFKFQDFECNGCHNLIMLSVSISNLAIITVKIFDYSCVVYSISKSQAINLLKNYVPETRGYI